MIPFVRCDRESILCPHCGEGALRLVGFVFQEAPDLRVEVSNHRVEVAPVRVAADVAFPGGDLRVTFRCDHCSYRPDTIRPFALQLTADRHGAASFAGSRKNRRKPKVPLARVSTNFEPGR